MFSSWRINRIRKKFERRLQEDYYFKRRILTSDLKKYFAGEKDIALNDMYASLNVGDYIIQSIVVQSKDESGNRNRRLDFEILIRNYLDDNWYIVKTIKGKTKYDYKNFELKLFELLWGYLSENLLEFEQYTFADMKEGDTIGNEGNQD